jgi:uncharacterized membrane protein
LINKTFKNWSTLQQNHCKKRRKKFHSRVSFKPQIQFQFRFLFYLFSIELKRFLFHVHIKVQSSCHCLRLISLVAALILLFFSLFCAYLLLNSCEELKDAWRCSNCTWLTFSAFLFAALTLIAVIPQSFAWVFYLRSMLRSNWVSRSKGRILFLNWVLNGWLVELWLSSRSICAISAYVQPIIHKHCSFLFRNRCEIVPRMLPIDSRTLQAYEKGTRKINKNAQKLGHN